MANSPLTGAVARSANAPASPGDWDPQRFGWRALAAVFLASTTLSVTGAVAPAAAQAVVNGTTVTVPGTEASPWNVGGGLTVGSTGAGTLNIGAGGQVNSTSAMVGQGASAVGTVTVTGAGSAWNMTGSMNLGNNGRADVSILDGANVQSEGATLATTATARSTVIVDGAGSSWDAGSGFFIAGNAGTSSLTVSNGATLRSGFSAVGTGAGSNSSALVTGAGTRWSAGTLLAGFQGNGTLTISGGAVVTSTLDAEGVSGRIGELAGANGVVTLSTGGSWTQNGFLKIGDEASGTLNIQSGATVSNNGANMGIEAGSRATVIVDGAGSLWDAGSESFTAANSGTAALAIRNGAVVLSGASTIAASAGSNGTATVSGPETSWQAGTLAVGLQGNGALTISDGAVVTSKSDPDGISGRIGDLSGAEGVVTLSSDGAWTQDGILEIGDAGTGTLNIGAASGAEAGALGTLSASSVKMGTNGRIVFNHTDTSGSYAVDTLLSGSGAMLHENGFTALTGTHTYTGATTVTGGTLAVDGTIASSPFAVSGSGLLMGSGTVGGLTLGSGGTVAPGGSIGTLTVTGDVSFAAGSTYEVEIDPSGTGDLISATGAVTLTGGTVLLRPAPGTYTARIQTIISAEGGVTGTFDTLDAPDFAFVTASLEYTPLTVDLVFKPKTTVATIGETPNQAATAKGVASLGAGNAVHDAVLFSATQEDALAALDALSGEIHASVTSAAYEDARWVRAAVLDRLRWMPCGDGAGEAGSGLSQTCVWSQGLGAWGETGGDGNAAAISTATGGVIMGAEATAAGRFRLGLAGGFTQTSLDVDGRASSGETTSVFGAAYGGAAFGAVKLRAGLSAGSRSIETERDVGFTGFAGRTNADYGGFTAQGFAEAGYEMKLRGTIIEPFAGLSLVRVGSDGFTELGGAAALEGEEMSQGLATTTLALRGQAALGRAGAENAPLVRGLIGWLHAFGDTAPEADLAFASGSAGYTVTGVPVAESALAVQAAFDWQAAGGLTAGVEYSGQIAADVQSHAIKANVSFTF